MAAFQCLTLIETRSHVKIAHISGLYSTLNRMLILPVFSSWLILSKNRP